jgi:hypothetical protein
MKQNTVFYAWQSDTDSKCNRYFIRDALRSALLQLSRDETVEDSPRLDHDTDGVPGTPSISDTIFEKIAKSRIFVGDVTSIGECGKKRPPNPNVMIELGYALHAVSSENVLLVMNLAHGTVEDLPFDLRNRRFPISYRLESSASKDDKRSIQKELTTQFATAIAAILKIRETPVSTRNLKVRCNPSWNVRRLYVQIQLFNSGPGPIFVESWFVDRGPKGIRGSFHSIKTIKGKLPVRIAEQDGAEIMVEIDDDIESITALGVVDGDHHRWATTDHQLDVFKHQAMSHRLPIAKEDELTKDELQQITVKIEAQSNQPHGMGHEQLVVVFTNLSNQSIPILCAELCWKYAAPRQMPIAPGKPSVAELGGRVTL